MCQTGREWVWIDPGAQPLEVTVPTVLGNVNEETTMIIQMESLEACEKLDEILAVEHYDVLRVGPADLSASLGVPGQIHHSKVANVMLDVAKRAEGGGKMLACTFGDPEDAHRWIREGYRMMNVSGVLALGTTQRCGFSPSSEGSSRRPVAGYRVSGRQRCRTTG